MARSMEGAKIRARPREAEGEPGKPWPAAKRSAGGPCEAERRGVGATEAGFEGERGLL